jgi:N-acetylglucosaminyldiphosphoundecaprenol N-acetyl-beta-D-mannosaminyltransferase
MIRAGLEWLWRMIIEPRRLARRYLVGNPIFIAAVVRQRFSALSVPRRS